MPVWIADLRGHVIRSNRPWALTDEGAIHPDDMSDFQSAWRTALEDGRDMRVDVRLELEGRFVLHRIHARCDGDAWYVVAFELGEELRRRRAIAHELRGPLHAIVGWVQMLRSAELDETTRMRALETIERNVRAQARLIKERLD